MFVRCAPNRRPACAGRFYPGDPERLAEMVGGLTPDLQRHPSIGLVAPHAGFVYSGGVAGVTFATATIPETVLLLGPKHTPYGKPLAIDPCGTWLLPGASVQIEEKLAAAILLAIPGLESCAEAHAHEHCLEVMLPFLRHHQRDLRIVPIVFGAGLGARRCTEIGARLAEVISHHPDDVLIVASTDMHHQGLGDLPPGKTAPEVVLERDALALERLEAFDPEGLVDTCRTHHITMCGVQPTAIMLAAARELGAKCVDRLAHTNSYDVAGGDASWVVGYAGYRVSGRR